MTEPRKTLLVVGLLTLWCVGLGAWFHSVEPGVFSRGMREDAGTMLWLQEWVFHHALVHFPDQFLTWDHPCPRTTNTVPSRTDLLLAVPWTALLEFPAQFHAHVTATAALAALGCALLARVMGAGVAGAVFAGVLGAGALPLWVQFWTGQANGAFVGPMMLGIAAGVQLLRTPLERRGTLAGLVLATAVAFALAGAIYPITALIWMPTAAVLLLPELREAGWKRTGLLVLAGVLSLALASGDLQRALAFQGAAYYQPSPAGPGTVPCVPSDGRLLLDRIALGGLTGTHDLEYGQAALGAWLFAPLALAMPRRRLRIGLVLLLGLLLVGASISPCPSFAPQREQLRLSTMPGWSLPVWERIASVHRYERWLLAALAHAAVLGGVGLSAFLRRGRVVAGIAGLLAVLSGAQVTRHLATELAAPAHRVSLDVSPVIDRIRAEQVETVAVLPPHEPMQFRVAIALPDHRFVNAYRPDRYTEHDDAFLMALGRLTTGRWPDGPLPPPGPGLDLVVLARDPSLCRDSELDPRERCGAGLQALLVEWLGPPSGEDADTLWWHLEGGPADATCGDLRRYR